MNTSESFIKNIRGIFLLMLICVGVGTVVGQNVKNADVEKVPLRTSVDVYCGFQKKYTVKAGEMVFPKFIQPYSKSREIVVEDRLGNRFGIPLYAIDRSKLKKPLLYKNTTNIIYLANGLFHDLDFKGKHLSELVSEWGEYTQHYYSREEDKHYYTFQDVRIAYGFYRGWGVFIETDKNFIVTGHRDRDWSWRLFCAFPFYSDIVSLNLFTKGTEFITEEQYTANNFDNEYNKYTYGDVMKKLFIYIIVYVLCFSLLILAMCYCRYIHNAVIYVVSILIYTIIPYIFIISFLEKYPLNWFVTLVIAFFIWCCIWPIILLFKLDKRCPKCNRMNSYSENKFLERIECVADIKFTKNQKGIFPLTQTILSSEKTYKTSENCKKCNHYEYKYSTKEVRDVCPNCGKLLRITGVGEDRNYGTVIFKKLSEVRYKGDVYFEFDYYYHVGCSDCGWSWNGPHGVYKSVRPISDLSKFGDVTENEYATKIPANSSDTQHGDNEDVYNGRCRAGDDDNQAAVRKKQQRQEEGLRCLREADEAKREYEYYKSKAQSLREQAATERGYARDAEWKYEEFKDESYRSLAGEYISKAESYESEARDCERQAEEYYRKYEYAKSQASSFS